jgi:hypothetical protein
VRHQRHVLRQKTECRQAFAHDDGADFRSASRTDGFLNSGKSDAVPPVRLLDAHVAIGFDIKGVEGT